MNWDGEHIDGNFVGGWSWRWRRRYLVFNEPHCHDQEDAMANDDQAQNPVKPTEQRGGTTAGEAEAREKGQWAATAIEGLVPAELGGSDAPREMLAEDPELGSSVLGRTTGSDEPATEDGIDPSGGDDADATSDGGPDLPPRGVEPDLKDAAGVPVQKTDVESGG
jgi:hypothetical protein